MTKQKLMLKVTLLVFVLAFRVTGASGGTPYLTHFEWNTPLSAASALVIFDSDSVRSGDCDGCWGNPSTQVADSGVSPVDPMYTGVSGFGGIGVGGVSCTGVTAEMFGGTTGFGQVVLQISAVTGGHPDQFEGQMQVISANSPVNRNTAIFMGERGPANINNVDLAPADIAAGTSMTFTVNMDGEPPHFLGVLGGSTPVVAYDSGTSILTFTTTTTGTTTEQGQQFDSIVGFMIFTDTGVSGFSRPAKRLAGHTNHWPGDMFFLLPGFDTFAEIDSGGGTSGTESARFGFSAYGPTDEQRDVSLFIPTSQLQELFGVSDADSLVPYAGDAALVPVRDYDVNNFSVDGHTWEFTYTFASPKDAAIGVSGTTTAAAGSSGGCFIEAVMNPDVALHFPVP